MIIIKDEEINEASTRVKIDGKVMNNQVMDDITSGIKKLSDEPSISSYATDQAVLVSKIILMSNGDRSKLNSISRTIEKELKSTKSDADTDESKYINYLDKLISITRKSLAIMYL